MTKKLKKIVGTFVFLLAALLFAGRATPALADRDGRRSHVEREHGHKYKSRSRSRAKKRGGSRKKRYRGRKRARPKAKVGKRKAPPSVQSQPAPKAVDGAAPEQGDGAKPTPKATEHPVESKSNSRPKHEQLYDYIRSHKVLPFTKVLEKVHDLIEGEIIETRFEIEDGVPVYEFKYITRKGRVLEIYMDAKTGAVIKKEAY